MYLRSSTVNLSQHKVSDTKDNIDVYLPFFLLVCSQVKQVGFEEKRLCNV